MKTFLWSRKSNNRGAGLGQGKYDYHQEIASSNIMGDPELVPELDMKDRGPLICQEGVEQLQNKYIQNVRKSVSEWMHKALEVELTDCHRGQEPDIDHEGYHTCLPTIITMTAATMSNPKQSLSHIKINMSHS